VAFHTTTTDESTDGATQLNAPDDIALAEQLKKGRDQVVSELKKLIVGQDDVVELVLLTLLVGGNSLIVGVPGLAKTLLIHTIAQVLDLKFSRIQFTPDLMPSDITGTDLVQEDPQTGRRELSFMPGPVFANIVLADEVNRTPPKTQAALLEAMQEHTVTVEGEGFRLPDPFIVVATQNPIDLEGTYPLPEAQIDRFLIHLDIGYPKREDEIQMLMAHHVEPTRAEPMIDASAVQHLQELVKRVHVDKDLYEYAVSLSEFTRSDARVLLGASPRASLSLIQAAKAAAILDGRGYCTPDDVRNYATPVLAHRLILADEVEAEASVRVEVIKSALSRVSYRKAIRPV
jgi:MoxR-like ATPase